MSFEILLLSLAAYLVVVGIFNYAMIKVIRKYWNYDTKDPMNFLLQRSYLANQLVNSPLYIAWLIVSIAYLQSLIALFLGIVGQFIVALAVHKRGSIYFQSVPLNILNYNYTMGTPKSRKESILPQFDKSNSKTGSRHEYWRGYGHYI